MLAGLLAKMGSPGKAAMLGGLLAEAQTDPAFGQAFREAMVPSRCRLRTAAVERAFGRCEIAADIDRPVLPDRIDGPVWYRLLVSANPFDEGFIDELSKHVLAEAAP